MGTGKDLIARIDKLTAPEAGEHTEKLKVYREQLARLDEARSNRNFTVAFIGEVGTGKTTAIARLLDLVDERNESLLPSASGRTTLCRMSIVAAQSNFIRIVPLRSDELIRLFEIYAESLVLSDSPGEERPGIAEEVAKALGNITGVRTLDDVQLSIEPQAGISEKLEFVKNNLQERARLDLRTKVEFPLPAGKAAHSELQKLVKDLNGCRVSSAPFPESIEIHLTPETAPLLSVVGKVVDTRGVDGGAVRKDLDEQLRDSHTICIFCSKFSAAPDRPTVDVLKRHKATTTLPVSELAGRSLILALARAEELAKMEDHNGDRFPTSQDAAAEKAKQIARKMKENGLGDFQRIDCLDAKAAESGTTARLIRFCEETIAGLSQKHESDFVIVEQETRRFIEMVEASTREKELAAAQEKINELLEELMNVGFDIRPLVPALRAQIGGAKPPTLWAATKSSYRGEYDKFNIYDTIGSVVRELLASKLQPVLDVTSGSLRAINRPADDSRVNDAVAFVERGIRIFAEELVQETESRVEAKYRTELKPDVQHWVTCQGFWGNPARRNGLGFTESIQNTFDARLLRASILFDDLNEISRSEWRKKVRRLMR